MNVWDALQENRIDIQLAGTAGCYYWDQRSQNGADLITARRQNMTQGTDAGCYNSFYCQQPSCKTFSIADRSLGRSVEPTPLK